MTRLFVAGHQGMVGSAICRKLKDSDSINLVTASRAQLDLTCQKDVLDFFEKNKIDEVIIAAARVGGILANSKYPVDFLYQNLMIQNNLINSAFRFETKKLIFLGSSCIYPKYATQPIEEDALLTGALEPTNEAYALAKIAGIKLCEAYRNQYDSDFRSLMPTNLYGPGDNFNLENSHVIPALLRKFHEAKVAGRPSVDVWGSGKAKREFMHVDDLADACLHVSNLKKDHFRAVCEGASHLNVGSGEDVSIARLVETIKEVVEFNGKVVWDLDKPDGTPRKVMNVSKLNDAGWKRTIDLKCGLAKTYDWYLKNLDNFRSM